MPIGLATIAVGVALVIWEARFRSEEARVTAWLLRLTGVGHLAVPFGTAVAFPIHDRWFGFSVTLACTAALLIVPFFVIAGLLVLSGRVSRTRALAALGLTAVLVFAVNQLRLLVIAGSMVRWGFQTGYERSHIFLGTMVSTLGVIAGVVIFVWMLVVSPERKRARMAHG